MKIKRLNTHIPTSDITDPILFNRRRLLLKALLATSTVCANFPPVFAADTRESGEVLDSDGTKLEITQSRWVENYTNYYEFTYDKEKSTDLAKKLITQPWSVTISGEVEKPITLSMDDILSRHTQQEYIYRFRCVEGWAMVVPWLGFPLVNLLKLTKPLSTAKFVKFTSVYQPESMPFQRTNQMLAWPYVEGLRIDEAVHPLTILATGMYGGTLTKQNGAPIRLIVPWKYGFKSAKAIVKIELQKHPPITTWNKAVPNEYGFYANVNPNVPHPRWSQASERLLGSGLFTPRRRTEIFNGYGEQVASMYRDMDLGVFF